MRGPLSFIGAVSLAGCLAQPSAEPIDVPLKVAHIEAAASEIQVQPFTVRMSKLSYVLDRPIDDPLFEALLRDRVALGDHDYARALRPDRRWSARKIGIWVRGVLPICRSARFSELYPHVASAPDGLILRAYGRPADEEDRSALAEVQAAGDLDRDTAVCVAILSSLELVAQ